MSKKIKPEDNKSKMEELAEKLADLFIQQVEFEHGLKRNKIKKTKNDKQNEK